MLRSISRSTQAISASYKLLEGALSATLPALSTGSAPPPVLTTLRTLASAAGNNNGKKQWTLLHHQVCLTRYVFVTPLLRQSITPILLGPRHLSRKTHCLGAQGYDVNPCNSPFHPAVEAGIEPDHEAEELPVQEAYTPESSCFGCGPSAADGLHLRSFRVAGGMEATVTLDSKYCAFPGIINGGVISALFDCHGNWTAAIALMDRGCLPKPPLTLTYEILVKYLEPTPPDEPLFVRSQIVRVTESGEVGSKATVQVDLTLHRRAGGTEKLLATATGLFKKLGALRAL
jgi:acyl-coenzyme A thioesterase PaaI-like protein